MHLLIVITVVPSLALPLFAWVFVSDRREAAASSGGIEAGFRTVAQLDATRVAVQTESSALSLRGFLPLLRLSPAERAGVTGPLLTAPVQQLLDATDRQFAALRRDQMVAVPGGKADVVRLEQTLRGIRQASGVLDRSTSASRSSLFAMVTASQQYSLVITRLQALEQDAIMRISQGELGSGSPSLARQTDQIGAVGHLAVMTSRQITQLATVSRNPGGKPTADLVATTGAVDTALADLGRHLTPQLNARLEKLRSDRKIKAYRESIADFMRTSSSAAFSIENLNPRYLVQAGQGSIEMSQQTSGLLAAAVADGVRQARSDRDAAAGRARDGALVATLIVAVTVGMLLSVGGMIRRRLTDLARAAQRISAGRFEVMAVHGPREVALASEGLNDAVRGLREIAVKAGLIARGDLSAPALQQPSPGPLGAAVHASFERVVTVIQERAALQVQLAHEASHDALTGLPNRAEAQRRLPGMLGATRREGAVVAVLFVDLDHFKEVNDTLGHHAGDHVLHEAASRMAAQVRTEDTVCRLGGDEFLIILGSTTAQAAQRTGDRIVQAVGEPIDYRGQQVHIGASVGMACWPDVDPVTPEPDATNPGLDEIAEELIGRADQAVYRAKAGGRNLATF
jgi:diguanylate cyclase (GGDEF)-like protein